MEIKLFYGFVCVTTMLHSAHGNSVSKTVEIAPGVFMPSVNLGTCCGSSPKVGLGPWLDAGGVGIDTAWDYHDQVDVASVLSTRGTKREDVFITTKVPAGFGNSTDCSEDPNVSLNYVKENLRELNVDYVDLVLLHAPCLFGAKHNNALWKGLMMAKEQNLTRSIGVSNYNSRQLEELEGDTPSVNQCRLSTSHHDDATMEYCQNHNITYEAYFALKGCDMSGSTVTGIAKAHNVTGAQVCLRWILQKGAIIASGTGSDASTVKAYAESDLDLFSFELTDAEMKELTE